MGKAISWVDRVTQEGRAVRMTEKDRQATNGKGSQKPTLRECGPCSRKIQDSGREAVRPMEGTRCSRSWQRKGTTKRTSDTNDYL